MIVVCDSVCDSVCMCMTLFPYTMIARDSDPLLDTWIHALCLTPHVPLTLPRFEKALEMPQWEDKAENTLPALYRLTLAVAREASLGPHAGRGQQRPIQPRDKVVSVPGLGALGRLVATVIQRLSGLEPSMCGKTSR